jgi:cytochrome c-type biogenesis protein CcmH/NrfF
MRDIVTRKLQAGESEEQILQFFVDRYGESVLAAPPKSGFSLLVWVVPPVGLLGAILLLYFLMKNMQRLGGREDMSQNIKTSKMLKNQINPYLRRVDQEIDLLGVENPETFHAADRE